MTEFLDATENIVDDVDDVLTGRDHLGKPDPIHVVIDGPAVERDEAADYTSFQTYTLGGTEKAFRIVPQARLRSRCVIVCKPGNASNTNGFVLLGRQQEVMNGQGKIMTAGETYTYQGQGAIFLAADGTNSLVVTVADEVYMTRDRG